MLSRGSGGCGPDCSALSTMCATARRSCRSLCGCPTMYGCNAIPNTGSQSIQQIWTVI